MRPPVRPHSCWPIRLTSILLMAGVFLVDLALPRGPAPAIGYCAVILLAVETRQRWFALGLTAACLLLTWIGYFLEPEGSAAWMSALNRAMVMAVICLTAVLDIARVRAHEALEYHAQELARSNRELEHFASVVSHDLRSPLMSIKGWTRLLERRLGPDADEETAGMLGRVVRSVDEMTELVTRLLQYSRVDAAGLNLADCDMNVVLERIKEHLRETIESAGATITSDPLAVVRADEVLLGQVLQNLVENAIKYRGTQPPSIHISARQHEAVWEFMVRDNGRGIGPEDRHRVFELFERAGQTRLHTPGSGIGLSTCKKIVERHGGCIWVESTPGTGSTFHFTIPKPPLTLRR